MVTKVVIKGEHTKVPTEQINKNRSELRAGQSLAVLTLNGKMAGKNASWFERFVIGKVRRKLPLPICIQFLFVIEYKFFFEMMAFLIYVWRKGFLVKR